MIAPGLPGELPPGDGPGAVLEAVGEDDIRVAAILRRTPAMRSLKARGR